jgi:hypothetical protein
MANEQLIMGKSILPENNLIGPGPTGAPKGPPTGYKPLTSPSPEISQIAKNLLRNDFGTTTPFILDNKMYMARVEPHYHPLGFKGGPNGWHKGVTVYEKSSTSATEPKPSEPSKQINNEKLYSQIDAFLDKFDIG